MGESGEARTECSEPGRQSNYASRPSNDRIGELAELFLRAIGAVNIRASRMKRRHARSWLRRSAASFRRCC